MPLLSMIIPNRYHVWMLLICLLSGCTLLNAGVASLRSRETFKPLVADQRIMVEPGAEKLAQQVAQMLPQAIDTVEKQLVRPFVAPVQIYICKNGTSLHYYTGMSPTVRGVVTNALFLSGLLADTPERIPLILTHELTHLHLYQHLEHLGLYHYTTAIPVWFHEGLAVMISEGGGAEQVTETEAITAMKGGAVITPNEDEWLLFRQTAHSYGMTPHMFYRQCGLFVSYLRNQAPDRFQELVRHIEQGRSFREAFAEAYGTSVQSWWRTYLETITGKHG